MSLHPFRALALGALAAALAACGADPCNNECPSGTVCDEATLSCVTPGTDGGTDGGGCATNDDCPAADAPYCETGSGRCVECLSGADCSSGRCDPAAFTCLDPGCSSDDDCANRPGLPYCGSDRECVECRTAGDCAPADGQRRTCDLSARVCVADPCDTDADCILDPAGKTCELGSGRCVECIQDAQCTGSERCLAAEERCVECLSDDDCRLELGETCDGATYECKVTGCATDATCDGPTRCETTSRQCVECLTSDDCAFGGDCEASACTAPSACAEDADCIWPGRCVEGACARCAADADCRAGESCVSGACVEPATCSKNSECGPGRVCTNGACGPVSCPADAFEPNDATEAATPLGAGRLNATLCPNELDHYTYDFQQGAGAEVIVRYDATLPEPVLELVSGQGGAVVVARGTRSATGVVRALVESAPAGTRALLVRVSGGDGRTVPYELETKITATAMCADDAREDDDTQVTAPAVAPGVFRGVLCPQPEEDWYAVDVPADHRPVARLVFAEPAPPAGPPRNAASVEIYTLVSNQLRRVAFSFASCDPAEAGCTPNEASASNAAPAGGARFWVLVRNTSSRKLRYDLRLDVRPKPPANDACEQRTPIAANQTVTGHTRGASDNGAASCGGEGGGDAFWTLNLAQHSRVKLTLTAEFTSVLAISSLAAGATCDAAVEVACAGAASNTQVLAFEALRAGAYVVRVDGAAGREGAYTLAAEIAPAEPAPAGEVCSAPEALALTGGVATVQGSVALATDDYAAGCGSAGADAMYLLELPEPQRLRATLTAFAGASLSLVGEEGCDAAEGATCVPAVERAGSREATLDIPAVAAGRYRLVVDGGSAVAGRYALRVELSEAIYPPANDLCEGAIGLVDVASEDTRGAANDFTPACGAASHSAGDAVYRLTVVGDEQIDLALDAAFDASLSITSGPCGTGPTVACADGLKPQLRLPSLSTGEYYVWVDGYTSGTGPFSLRLTRSAPVAIPANDACTAAEAVDLGAGPATRTGSTARATDDLHPTACAPTGGSALDVDGPDVVYAVTVPAGRMLKATLTPTDFDGAIYVLEGCEANACLGAADRWFQSGAVETVTVGNSGATEATWRVVVDSWRSSALGSFELKLELL